MTGTFCGGVEKRIGGKHGSLRIDPVEFARKMLHFEPDEPQQLVLRSEAKRGILNCTRQWGKSTITAAKAVHRAYSEPESLVLVASPTDRQSGEFVRKTRDFVRETGITPKGDGGNKLSVALPNGSRIVGLPGKEQNVRGFSGVSMLLIDEAAVVDDELYAALRPMLAVKEGDLWLMSTPRGMHGFFYKTWVEGGDGWARLSVPATKCPRISSAFLEEERREMGTKKFMREYMTEFDDRGAGMFGRPMVERAMDGSVRPIEIGGTY